MKGHYVALVLLTLALAAGAVACSLPLSLTTEEIPETEMTPPAIMSQADYQVVHETLPSGTTRS